MKVKPPVESKHPACNVRPIPQLGRWEPHWATSEVPAGHGGREGVPLDPFINSSQPEASRVSKCGADTIHHSDSAHKSISKRPSARACTHTHMHMHVHTDQMPTSGKRNRASGGVAPKNLNRHLLALTHNSTSQSPGTLFCFVFPFIGFRLGTLKLTENYTENLQKSYKRVKELPLRFTNC